MEFIFSDATFMKVFEILDDKFPDIIKVKRISGVIEVQTSTVDWPLKSADMPGYIMEHVLEKRMRCIFLRGNSLNPEAIVKINLASAQKRLS